MDGPQTGDVARRAGDLRWYHTLDLPGGVETPGEYDLRPTIPRLPLPAGMSGMRCLDVGSRDGFYAFEMERRGATDIIAVSVRVDHHANGTAMIRPAPTRTNPSTNICCTIRLWLAPNATRTAI